MKKNIFFLLIAFAFFSCNNDEDSDKERCVDSKVPCPVIIGEENKGCVANIIFLAEGFTDSEMTEFIALCDVAKQAILDMEPFASASHSLNFYRVNSPSKTSGIKTKEFTSVCNQNGVITTSSNTA